MVEGIEKQHDLKIEKKELFYNFFFKYGLVRSILWVETLLKKLAARDSRLRHSFNKSFVITCNGQNRSKTEGYVYEKKIAKKIT